MDRHEICLVSLHRAAGRGNCGTVLGPRMTDHGHHGSGSGHDAHAMTDPLTHPQHQDGPANHAAHDKHAGHDPDAFRRQFWVVLALTIPVVIWSEEVQHWLGYMAPSFPGSEWIPPILGTVVFLYGGRVFLAGARAE